MEQMEVHDFLTPDQVCALIPGLTKTKLAQLRLVANAGPKFYKPTPRTVIYKRSEVLEWLDSSARLSTVQAVSS